VRLSRVRQNGQLSDCDRRRKWLLQAVSNAGYQTVCPSQTVYQNLPKLIWCGWGAAILSRRLAPDYSLVIAPASVRFSLDKVFKASARHG
jgi:hypothetical protein